MTERSHRPALPAPIAALAAVALATCLAPAPSHAVEVAARLGVSNPWSSQVQLGPTAGLSLSVPVRGRLALLAAADFSIHDVSDQPDHRIDSLTAALGLEASIDLAPVVPVLSVGPAFQHAWRPGSDATSDAFGGFLAIGLRATVLDHLRIGLQARYLTASFTNDAFPAFVTFVLEVGWTSGE